MVRPRAWRAAALVAVAAMGLPDVVVGERTAEGAGLTVPSLRQPTMTVHGRVNMLPWEANVVIDAAAAAGARAHPVHKPTIAMTGHTRDGNIIWAAPGSVRIPMATTVAPLAHIEAIGGRDLRAALASDAVAVGEVTAARRRIAVGDVLVLRDRHNRRQALRVGAIVGQDLVGGGDLLVSTETSRPRFGALPIKQVVVTGIRTPESVVVALRARGVFNGTRFRIRNSWDIEDPDSILGSADVASIFGQLSYSSSGPSRLSVTLTYRRNLVQVDYSGVALRHHCHVKVVDAVQSALNEIAEAGLAGRIDVAQSNDSGGCFVSRYARFQGYYGTPSRHAWGIAFDINTTTNAQGAVPRLDCGVVRIMRKWGFAWGGNFLLPDGMHFEYVGGRRDLIGYPSRYCPNLVDVPPVVRPVFPGDPPPPTTTTTTTTTTVAPPP